MKVQMISILLKYILWYEFVIDLDAQSDFEIFFSQKTGSNSTILNLGML